MSNNPTLDLIEKTGKKLSNIGIINGKQEIVWYLEYKKLLTLSQLYTNNIELSDTIIEQIKYFFSKRKTFQPFQYIINQCEFYGRTFYVDYRVLIPRPETEILINFIKNKKFNKCLEIGIGSGAISITLLLSQYVKHITATDISQDALDVAAINFKKFKLENYILMKHNILTETLPEKYDLIISNPPYITKEEYANLSNDVKSYEPKIALTDNGDGLLFYNRFAEILDDMLTSNGLFLCEISSTVNSVRLSSLFTKHGIKTKILQDMNNKNRLLVGSIE